MILFPMEDWAIHATSEEFLNNLKVEVISVIPNAKQTFQLMGNSAKIDHLLIVEKRDYAM